MASAYARTLGQVINDTQRLMNDFMADGSDGKLWTWSEIRTAVQDTLLEMVRRTGILKDSRVIFLKEDEQVYDLPPECIRILRVGIHRATGSVLLPTSISARDYETLSRSSEGYPTQFYRDHTLAPNQIGFIPRPDKDGSSFVRDSDHGLLRRIQDEDGNTLPYDANRALRRISGVPIRMSGRGRIIRGLISLYGNVRTTYVRAPAKWARPGTYPDNDIPVYLHKDIKYGVAGMLLKGSKRRGHMIKQARFEGRWEGVIGQLQRRCEHQGVNVEVRPI